MQISCLQADCSADGPGLRAVVIAENLNVHERTVHRVRQRYAEEALKRRYIVSRIKNISQEH